MSTTGPGIIHETDMGGLFRRGKSLPEKDARERLITRLNLHYANNRLLQPEDSFEVFEASYIQSFAKLERLLIGLKQPYFDPRSLFPKAIDPPSQSQHLQNAVYFGMSF